MSGTCTYIYSVNIAQYNRMRAHSTYDVVFKRHYSFFFLFNTVVFILEHVPAFFSHSGLNTQNIWVQSFSPVGKSVEILFLELFLFFCSSRHFSTGVRNSILCSCNRHLGG